MADYRIEENEDWGSWHAVLDTVYAGNPQYVYPLRSDIEGILSEKNAAYDGQNLRRWIVRDGTRPVGRIAAFIDTERNKQLTLPVGGIGFFESIDDAVVADLLFTEAENYLRERGMQAVDGPINFGERDKFWGLLVRGWYRPIYQETYNPPYYLPFFENRGYQPHEQCLTMRGVVSEFPGERLGKLAARVRERYGLYTEQIRSNNLRKGAEDFAEAYNAAFNHWPYFMPLTGDDIYPTFRQMKPIMDPHLTCIAYNREGRPIGLAGLIPDINCFLGGVNGKLNWRGLPKFLYRLKFQRQPRNCKGIAFGIAREYQRQGVYPLMVDAMFQSGDRHTSRTYRYVDMATIRGHNKLMVDTCRQMNTDIHRVHLAYRKALTPDANWEPFEKLDVSEVPMGKYGVA
ncbi:hypothetical protein CLV84_0076 [Neolewinella xylanilytica]|uniref:N-acetyltransferase domain-containing protein n=1 Tax=Neolewinella xylanilytica TaxID=1514080 RepID=A0A2S6I6J5_9BACT|nr:hypothetical protein [Neolewinella xylanilytica]PPK87142.1 hypothetical protein CLV84_0076 [Neolewinella xylanilytica]